MAALLINTQPGDEVIMPSYTFVSTVNAFVLRGAIPVFCDIREDNLNIDENLIESLITKKTKAIVPVHYAGVACEMDKIISIAQQNGIYVIEDAAQGVSAKYKGKHLGSIGDIGCFSFHETKNFSMGEGGAICLNKEEFFERAEILREKGTNRSKFFRGQVDKYTWVDIGSSYLPSDLLAAVLWCQFEHLNQIQDKRKEIFESYYNGLLELQDRQLLRLPIINRVSDSNYHMFYIILKTEDTRNNLMDYLKSKGVHVVFHYIPLHESDYYKRNYGRISLPKTEEMSRRLLRLPLFYSLEKGKIGTIIHNIFDYFLLGN